MTLTVPTVTAGDDVRVKAPQTLIDPATGAIYNASTATISAAITDETGATVYVAATAQSSGESGSNWAQGIVVCAFPAAATAAIPNGYCWLEIQATKAGVKTTFPRMQLWGQVGAVP